MSRPIWALGMMSGTSLDGVDAALLRTDGVSIHEFGPSAYRSYCEEERALLRSAIASASERPAAALDAAAEMIADAHAEAAEAVMAQSAAPQPEIVGFHGQTVAHRPDIRMTRQIGDAARLAKRLRLSVVSDFRSSDVAAGGEGAPLAPFHHFALARRAAAGGEAAETIAFLNLGGVGNVTFVDPAYEDPAAPGAVLAFDTGPGNALIDDFVHARRGAAYDADGAVAAAGRPDMERVAAWLSHGFFERRPPKSLDRNDFAGALADVSGASDADGAATLMAFTVEAIARAAAFAPRTPSRWLVCGGGRKNAALMAALSRRLEQRIEPIEALGVDGDMVEAHAFGHLAVRSLRGLPISAPGSTGAPEPMLGGRLTPSV